MISDVNQVYNIQMEFLTNIWYLIKTKPRMEDIAEINLNNQGIEYFLPRSPSGKREGKVVFPGYIFIKAKTKDTFQSIRSTRGLIDFIRFEMTFATASDETINELKEIIDVINDQMDKTHNYQKGEEIFVKSGVFKDFNGIFEKYDANDSAIILINFLSNQQRVKIKLSAIS